MQPPPVADALEWICAMALMEHEGCFPPGLCAAPPLLSEPSQHWSEWGRARGDTLVAFVAAGMLVPSHPFPKGCRGSPTFGSMFAVPSWCGWQVMHLTHLTPAFSPTLHECSWVQGRQGEVVLLWSHPLQRGGRQGGRIRVSHRLGRVTVSCPELPRAASSLQARC